MAKENPGPYLLLMEKQLRRLKSGRLQKHAIQVTNKLKNFTQKCSLYQVTAHHYNIANIRESAF